MSDPDAFGDRMRAALARVEDANRDAVARVCRLIVDRWSSGGLVYAAGAGHSTAAVTEAFYRAGGLAFVRPVYHPELFPLNGAMASTLAERRSGLAGEVLSRYALTELDVVVVFSNSGINPYPVELALGASAAGATVVAVTSVHASRAAPARAEHRLFELADETLDTLVPPGDASWPPEAPVTGALSSLATVFVWNLVLAATLAEADARGLALPLWRSANAGSEAPNGEVHDRYLARIPELG